MHSRRPHCGKHLIIEVWIDENIQNKSVLFSNDALIDTLKAAVKDAGAEIIDSKFHCFGEGDGFTGLILLSESHLSIHTWPEHGYAAIDIFMCGDCDPKNALPKIVEFFVGAKIDQQEIIRGILS